MTAVLETPDVAGLDQVAVALRRWQREDAPIQLHPGDLGWRLSAGATTVATLVRLWRKDGEIRAAGFLDAADVFRMTVAPDVWDDDRFARQVVADLSDPEAGVLPAGTVSVEVPDGSRVQQSLDEGGWVTGESWTPLRRDLTAPVGDAALSVEVVESAAQVSECTAVHRSAWGSERFTDDMWQTMAAGSPFADARCLLARDDRGVAVATVTVWSAGPGRPGLVEPLGVHADHRRRGYGAAICRAAAAELQKLGSSSVAVCTPTSLRSAVGTYRAAGFEEGPARLDRTRTA